MEITQKKNSNKIRFAFGEEALDYSLGDSSGSRSYSVPYTDISRDRQTRVERNQSLENVGLLLIEGWRRLNSSAAIDGFRIL